MANIEKRISKKGIKSYRVKVRLKGFKYKTKTFSKEIDAVEWGTAIEKSIKIKKEVNDLDVENNDISQLVLRLPLSLSENIKRVAPRGQRSQFIITLLNDYFSKESEHNVINVKRYASVKQIPIMYPAFTIGGIRHLIHNHIKRNFTKCFKKIGSKIVIDLDSFESWIGYLEVNNEKRK